MNLPDLIQIKQITDLINIQIIPKWLIAIIILLIGYISIKYFTKSYGLKNKIDIIDKLFLIFFFGITIFLKFLFIILIMIGFIMMPFFHINNIYTFLFGTIFLLIILIWSILVTIFDLTSIKKIVYLKKITKYSSYTISIFFSIIILIITIFIWNDISNLIRFFKIFISFNCFISLIPTIFLVSRWYKRISV